MELWVESTSSSHINEQADRIWNGSSPDVAIVQIDDYKGQEQAISLVGMIDWILIYCSDWTMIPLENIVSIAAGSGTRIAVSIDKEVELSGAAFALQHGVDALLLPPNESIWNAARNIIEIRKSTNEEKMSNVELTYVSVKEVSSVGVGERVCIDLIERLEENEGMLIGSSANALALVNGETVPSEFVPTRPFRVNAGAVHAYCLMADGSTRYLSELVAGDRVSIIDSSGSLREASVGRLKIEKRPFLVIKFETSSSVEGQIIVQQAETVRLVGKNKLISVTSLESGDRFLVRLASGMRHIGRSLEGEMIEK
mgnify:FL=1|tara:strand:- start:68543 stop:69478 length:936 start_codon:yes stop_codon:yes gene_type:complete